MSIESRKQKVADLKAQDEKAKRKQAMRDNPGPTQHISNVGPVIARLNDAPPPHDDSPPTRLGSDDATVHQRSTPLEISELGTGASELE